MATAAHQGERELRWLNIASCLVAVIEPKKISDELWAEWLAAIERPAIKTLLVCAEQALRLDAKQWRSLTSTLKGAGVRAVVVTDQRENAAHVKKAAWLGADIQSFRWDNSFYDALVHLGLDFAQRKQVKPKLQGLVEHYGAKLGAPGQDRRSMPAWMREQPSEPRVRPRTRASSSASPSASQANATRSSANTERKGSTRGELTAEFQRSRDAVFQSSSDIQAKLAEVQARLRARNLEMQRSRG